MLYGGSIAPGRFRGKDVTIQDVFEAIGAHAAGDMSDEDLHELEDVASSGRRRLRRPVHREHDGHGLRDAWASPPMGSGMVPAEDGKKGQVAEDCGRLVMELLEKDLRPSAIITRESLENAIACVAATGGSTNAVLHLMAIANEMGVALVDRRLRPHQLEDAAARRPEAGRPVRRHRPLRARAACGVVAKRLLDAGLLHEDALTVSGRTIGEEADARRGGRGPGGRAAARQPAQRRPAASPSCTATSRPTAAW